ncbi:MAG: hypothetical protein ACRDQH_00680 [Pseudonocardiaceae bacterium]
MPERAGCISKRTWSSKTGSPDLASALGRLSVSAQHLVVVGEVAGAVQGWPLVLNGGVIEACAQAADGAPLLTAIGSRVARDEYELDGGARLRVIAEPALATRHGLLDLSFTPSGFPRGYADFQQRTKHQ